MVRAQYCFRLNWVRLWYDTLVQFVCSKMIEEGTTSIVCIYLRIWPRETRTRVVQSLLPSSSINYWLVSRSQDTSGSRPKVPFVVTCHVWSHLDIRTFTMKQPTKCLKGAQVALLSFTNLLPNSGAENKDYSWNADEKLKKYHDWQGCCKPNFCAEIFRVVCKCVAKHFSKLEWNEWKRQRWA